MNFFNYLNSTLGSCLVIILVAVDYLRKYNTDNFQRRLLIVLLSSVFIAAIFDYLGLTLERSPGEGVNIALHFIWSIYLIARNCTYYYCIAFIDYFTHGNAARTKRIFKAVTAFMILYTISIIPNFQYGYYFNISRDNVYVPGSLYLLQLVISYFPVIIIMINISLAPKSIKRTQIFLTSFFIIATAVGATIDVVLRTATNLLWPCVTAAILYMYFFIIRSDSNIDNLTGIGNRNSFFEYINKLNKESNKKNYAFVKIDLDRFREINNTLGYLEGDNALRNVAAIIKNSIRHNDFAARFGNDEFILITTEENDIQRIINRINDSINTQNIKHKRPYQLNMNYIYDVYTTNSGSQIQDFLAQLDNKLDRIKEKETKDGE